MNYTKKSFTVEQFLALPVYETAREAPARAEFLLAGRMATQKKYLNSLIEKHGFDGIKEQLKSAKNNYLKVSFWVKYSDGNVGERGANISFAEASMTKKDDKLIINTGDAPTFQAG